MPVINTEAYFSELPKVDIKRSIFNMPFNHKTSFNVGQLIPFYVLEVLPGDTHQVRTSIVARLQTLLTPIMDSLELETFYFFVPNRLVDDHWKNIMGENDNGPWIQDKVDYSVPYLTWPEEESPTEGEPDIVGYKSGTIADYMGVPLWMDSTSAKDYPMAYPFRGYAMCVNEFFRDQNLQQPVVIHKDSVNRQGTNGSNYITDLELGGMPFVVNRYHDYFSSCLPAPQKSEPVSIFGNVGPYNPEQPWNGTGPFAPVITRGENAMKVTLNETAANNGNPWSVYNGNIADGVLYSRGSSFRTNVVNTSSDTVGVPVLSGSNDDFKHSGWYPSNLWANLNIPDATINNLRLAFQLQKYYEKQARGGTRYREFLREFFGVTNGDARMQIPEYLGGHRVPLSIHQVANTSETDSASLGDLGAMSNTSTVHNDFRMSFTEHGFVLGMMCVRFKNTFSQGLQRFWSRRTALDFYTPVFAHISEQPVFTKELYAYGVGVGDRVWGYNEAWADYRYMPNRVSGEMRPEVTNSLASWHLADDYDDVPSLSSSWLQVDKETVDRVLAVTSDVANQVFADIFVEDRAVRPMPVHSIPGFADHF